MARNRKETILYIASLLKNIRQVEPPSLSCAFSIMTLCTCKCILDHQKWAENVAQKGYEILIKYELTLGVFDFDASSLRTNILTLYCH
jgi:hypothetical protein